MKISIIFILFLSMTFLVYADYRDTFEEKLDEYFSLRNLGTNLMLGGSIGMLTGFTGGSAFATMDSLEVDFITDDVRLSTDISSYTIVGVSAVVTFIGFLIWKKNSDNYLEMLRLQMKYNNLIGQRE